MINIFDYKFNNSTTFEIVLAIAIGIIYFTVLLKKNNDFLKHNLLKAIIDYGFLLFAIAMIASCVLTFGYLFKSHLYFFIILPLLWLYICYRIIIVILVNDLKYTSLKMMISYKYITKAYTKVNVIASYVILFALMIGGLFSLCFGIFNAFNQDSSYVKVNATVISTGELRKRNSITYRPTYQYIVNHQAYFAILNHYTNIKYNIGSRRMIKYESANPNHSFIITIDPNIICIIAGLMMTLISTIIILTMFHLINKEKILKFILPLLFGGAATLIYYSIASDVGTYNPLLLLIKDPIVLAAYFLIVLSLFFVINKKAV